MKQYVILLLWLLGVLSVTPVVYANEYSGFISTEYIVFLNDPLYADQQRTTASFSAEPEYFHEFENGSQVKIIPFGRYDAVDSNRTHVDLREFNWMYSGESCKVLVGIGKIFWGVTEFVHLVDIINQTDSVENIDGESKLGQPMLQFSYLTNIGAFDFFILPGFRERTFPGNKGRLRSSIVVEMDKAEYESGAKEKHIDFAIRYNHSIGDVDSGIYYFRGTGREPILVPNFDDPQNVILIPFYEQITQTGLDLQWILGSWLLKAEAIYRNGKGDDFFSGIGGVEYTFFSIADTKLDLGIIGEYAYDERGEQATVPYQRDVMAGCRLTLNDMANSEILTGISHDIQNSSNYFTIEASRRIGNNFKITIESGLFLHPAVDDIMYDLREDDFIRLEVAYYF